MRCPHCNAEVAPGASFCGHCGTRLTPSIPAPAKPQTQPHKNTPLPSEKAVPAASTAPAGVVPTAAAAQKPSSPFAPSAKGASPSVPATEAKSAGTPANKDQATKGAAGNGAAAFSRSSSPKEAVPLQMGAVIGGTYQSPTFAEGLPKWNLVPPAMMVMRKKKAKG